MPMNCQESSYNMESIYGQPKDELTEAELLEFKLAKFYYTRHSSTSGWYAIRQWNVQRQKAQKWGKAIGFISTWCM
jgi:hypothetical protein